MKSETTKPTLIFFRSYPEDIMDWPPLVSSLQTLETCLLLIGLQRFPHAHTACAAAIESVIKAVLKKEPEDKEDFKILMNQVKARFTPLARFQRAELITFRNVRNKIAHYGYSPDDDEVTAASLLATGFSLLDSCYQNCFNFSLLDALEQNIARHLRAALTVYAQIHVHHVGSGVDSLRSLAHLIRWSVRHSLMAHWEAMVLDEAESSSGDFEAKDELMEHLERAFDPCWQYDCPVCDEPETFICQIESAPLDAGEVRIIRGRCIGCGLNLPPSSAALAQFLLDIQIAETRQLLLEQYGKEVS